MTDDLNFAHDIREDVREVAEQFGLEQQDEDGLLFHNDILLIELQDQKIDFDTGQLIGTVRVETPNVQTVMLAERIDVANLLFTIRARDHNERFQLVPGGDT